MDNPGARARLIDLIREYSDILKTPDEKLTFTSRVKHRIITENVPPILKRPYKVPFKRRQALDKEIAPMLENGVIEESRAPGAHQ